MTQFSVPTRVAHWGLREHRYFGHAVFGELAGQESFIGLTALSVLGRRMSPADCRVIEDAAACMAMADPRIWPLKMTRVLAAYGTTISAAAAGLLIQEGAQIGPWVCCNAAEALTALSQEIGDDLDDLDRVHAVVERHLARHRFVWGFGTPFRAEDERLVAFRACLERRERSGLRYLRCMERVAVAVRRLRRAEPNIGIGVATALLDLGLTPTEIGSLTIALTQHMFLANALEGVRPEHAFPRQLPEQFVTFVGRAPRSSPRAAR